MGKKSTAKDLLQKELAELEGKIPERLYKIVCDFVGCYFEAAKDRQKALEKILLFLKLLKEEIHRPFQFELYHKKIRSPFDYYRFGLDFVALLIEEEKSVVFGENNLRKIEEALRKKENVVLLANHQTEPDPQAIAILLEKKFPLLAESIIYVAGERVVTDPLAIPFSMGCDLLCIYSKRYIDHPIEQKSEKQLHNKSTMELMSRLLKEGGKIIYVAPSGGRDRKNSLGKVEVAPFDPDSIEMFYLMAKKSKQPTHFYPLSLSTYELFPPPETIQKELGEARLAKRVPVFLSFLDEFDMEDFPGSEAADKIQRRKQRSDAIYRLVSEEFERISQKP